METVRPLLIKYIYIAAISIIFLTYLQVPSVSLGASLILSVFTALALYFAGDRFLLPRFGTVASAIANFVIAAVIFSLANAFVREPVATGTILAASAVIGVAEWFYFRYVRSEAAPVAEGEDFSSLAEFLGEPAPGNEEGNPGTEGDQSQEHRDQPDNPGSEG